jgi:MFS family permease
MRIQLRYVEPIIMPSTPDHLRILDTETVDAPNPGGLEEKPRSVRTAIILLMAMLFYQGYISAIVGIGSPWIAKSFGLDQSGIAAVFAWLALSSLGALGLSRMADKAGRRRVMMWCMTAMPFCALGAAVSTRLAPFIGFAILLNAFGVAAATSAIVVVAEILPIDRRASGQSHAGIAVAAGGGLGLALMPILIARGLSWRWMLWVAAAGIVLFPTLALLLPESERWELAAQSGDTARTRFYDLFAPRYRNRSTVLTICTLLATLCSEGVTTYVYFHAVSVVGLSAAAASTMIFIGGGLGMIGFPIGAWSSERFGRVPTLVASGIAVAMGGLLFYWGPPKNFASPFQWLSASFCMLTIAQSAATVATNAAITELYPTSLRGTSLGWFALISAGASLTAESTIAILAKPFGGLSRVVGWLGLLAIPGSILFGLAIDETRGLSLEDAANEEEFRRPNP